MPLQFIAEFLFALVDLLRMSLIVSIPAFLLTLPGQFLFKRIRQRLKMSWMQAAFLSSFAVMLPLVLAVYLFPLAIAVSQTPSGPVPGFIQMNAVEYALAFFLTAAKNLVTAVVFTIMLMPMLFLAVFISEKLGERFKLPAVANTFASVFCASFIAWIIIIFIFPWIYTGTIYLLYWSAI